MNRKTILKKILLTKFILLTIVYILVNFLLNFNWIKAQGLNPEVVWAMPKSARIKCVTDVPGRMTVEYGTTPALGQISPPEWRDWPNTDVTRHYVNLLNLQPNTTYYYRVRITPQGGGSDLVSDVRSFKTFRNFSKVLPTVRYSSYIIGGFWSNGDTNAPYHTWNAQHYDLDIAYDINGVTALKAANPEAVAIRYGNITNDYATMVNGDNSLWAMWADEQGISYEHCALHYAVDSEVNIADVNDRAFDYMMVWIYRDGQWRPERFDWYSYSFPNQVGDWFILGNALRFDIMTSGSYSPFDAPAECVRQCERLLNNINLAQSTSR